MTKPHTTEGQARLTRIGSKCRWGVIVVAVDPRNNRKVTLIGEHGALHLDPLLAEQIVEIAGTD